ASSDRRPRVGLHYQAGCQVISGAALGVSSIPGSLVPRHHPRRADLRVAGTAPPVTAPPLPVSHARTPDDRHTATDENMAAKLDTTPEAIQRRAALRITA